MDSARDYLKTLNAGRVLDVATGSGNFIHFLIENLNSFNEIIGVDSNEKGKAAFEQAFAEKSIHFMKMDAEKMDFPDGSFDTVCISNSLHHMRDLARVLTEMKRILRPGGHFVINEMFHDNQSTSQVTHVLIHHWFAAIDRAMGVMHAETFNRQQILDILSGLELQQISEQDMSDLAGDPRDVETVKNLSDGIDQAMNRINGLPEEAALRQQGLELVQRVREIGFHNATSLLCVARKPPKQAL
jgi:ubiquinone/menaquinone biosynthesis C-methylase UbiE